MTTITIPKKMTSREELVAIPRKDYEKFLYILKILPKDQLWFWTKEWQKKEKEANEDIDKGKVFGPFSSGKELLKSLKS